MDCQAIQVTTPEVMSIKPMIVLTPVAADKVREMLAQKNLQEHGLRVFISGSGCSGLQYGLAFENQTENGDIVFESAGVRVYLDSTSAQYLEGATVDFLNGPMGEGFHIENPNATSTCACGQSSGAQEGDCACGQ